MYSIKKSAAENAGNQRQFLEIVQKIVNFDGLDWALSVITMLVLLATSTGLRRFQAPNSGQNKNAAFHQGASILTWILRLVHNVWACESTYTSAFTLKEFIYIHIFAEQTFIQTVEVGMPVCKPFTNRNKIKILNSTSGDLRGDS